MVAVTCLISSSNPTVKISFPWGCSLTLTPVKWMLPRVPLLYPSFITSQQAQTLFQYTQCSFLCSHVFTLFLHNALTALCNVYCGVMSSCRPTFLDLKFLSTEVPTVSLLHSLWKCYTRLKTDSIFFSVNQLRLRLLHKLCISTNSYTWLFDFSTV